MSTGLYENSIFFGINSIRDKLKMILFIIPENHTTLLPHGLSLQKKEKRKNI